MVNSKHILVFSVALGLAVPQLSVAATQGAFEISAWVPYWRTQAGVADANAHIDFFAEINPFVYTVKSDGTLNDAGNLGGADWRSLQVNAQSRNIRYIPTVMWASADAIDDTLRDPVKRANHVRAIASEVYRYNLDGIDIDYEAKYARTRDYFSLFLKELNDAIGFDKQIICTVESRTPLTSRYSTPEAIPADIEYSNDFTAFNKYCDRVRIMAYDQGRIDVQLNKQKGHPYIPVADVDWVRKTIELAAQEIDKDKLIIGIPTYGYEYDTFTDANGVFQYSRLWSFNPTYATDTATKLGIAPTRNSAGELFLTYPAAQSPDPIIPLPNATRVMSWSDAQAIKDKVELARELGVRGVAIFKVDGGEDAQMWNVLAPFKNATVSVPETATNPSPTPSPRPNPTPTPGMALTPPSGNLFYGMRTADVLTLQKMLNHYGFTVATSGGGSVGNETTFFGPATRAALARFQKAHNVAPAVGYYGPLTRAAFRAL